MTTLPEVWAGVECSHVRVGDRWADQLSRTGHATRVEDLDLLAGLGVTAIRYPVLWGWSGGTPPGRRPATVVPDPRDDEAWAWSDRRLLRLRELGIRPIVGLLHHGGGPLPDGFLDDGFVEAFGAYAGAVARRYPWITDLLPINEPLTNARFAGVSGVWHPHGTDVRTFARLFVRQCLGIRAAMRAIREVIPHARLLANEDLGRAFGTPPLADAVEFLNERRWLTFEALMGRLDRGHWMHGLLAVDAATVRDLESLVADPIPPDLLGLDHYVVSDRFLDHRIDAYPAHVRGGDRHRPYADAELVRVQPDAMAAAGATIEPFSRAIRETWERYRLPIVLAEVQLAGEPDDQIAWWRSAWAAGLAARRAGVDLRAVTAWSALGAYDWPSLLAREDGIYEPGAFDVRSSAPTRTALGDAIAAAAAGRDLPTLQEVAHTGWWDRPERSLWPLDSDELAA